MANTEFEKDVFSNQDDIANHLDYVVGYEVFTESPPLPEENIPVSEDEQLDEDEQIVDMMDDLRELRRREFNHASWLMKARVDDEGPYSSSKRPYIDDPSIGKKRQQTIEEYAKTATDNHARMRSEFVTTLTTKFGEGNSTRILARLRAEADSHSATIAAAPGAVAEAEAGLTASRHANRDAKLALDRAAISGPLVALTGTGSNHPGALKATRKSNTYRPQDLTPQQLSDPSLVTAYNAQLARYDAAQRDLGTGQAVRDLSEKGYALRDSMQTTADAQRVDYFHRGHTYKHNGITYHFKGFAESITEMTDAISAEHEMNSIAADTKINEAKTELSTWLLGTNDPAIDSNVSATLEEAGDYLDELSLRDEGRAELREKLVTQRFRQEQRIITYHANNRNETRDYRSFYTDDGGIYIYTGKDGGGVVLYEDGSTSRLEKTIDDAGNTVEAPVRRHGNGQIWTEKPVGEPTEVDFDSMTDAQLDAEKDIVFKAWEEERDPVKKKAADAILDANVKRLDGRAADLTEANFQLQDEQAEIRNNIAKLSTEFRDLNTDALDLERQASVATDAGIAARMRQEAADLRDIATSINDNINDFNRRGAVLDVTIQANLGTIESTRLLENRDIYWLGALSSEAVPPAGTPGRIGHVAMSGVMEMPPHLQANGVLVWNNTTINGVEGRWSMRPDGEAIHYDTSFSRTHDNDGNPLSGADIIPTQNAVTQFAPDGRRLSTRTFDRRTVTYNRDGSIDTVI